MSDKEKKYEIILAAEQSFAREVALGVHTTRPLTVWHYLIPGMFIIDFLRRGSAIKRYSYHFMLPRKLAMDAARSMGQGEDKSEVFSDTEEKTKTWLHSLSLFSNALLRSQMGVIRILTEHYSLLIETEGDALGALIENAYKSCASYESFLSRLASAEEDVDRSLLETLGNDEKLRTRLETEMTQVKKQREKLTDRLFFRIG